GLPPSPGLPDISELPEMPDLPPEPPQFAVKPEDDEKAQALLTSSKNSHELYIGMVKSFGQKKGREMYRNYKSKFRKA
ncbi:MAG: hypothetical protein FWH20_10845, partial [Oscillospiraceae bacterium]|nr:hypothetical protein [Oscillospiraceae bacterium]